MLTKEEYIKLYEKYLSGNCSEEELHLLEDYEDAFQWEDTAGAWDSEEAKEAARARIYDCLQEGMVLGQQPVVSLWRRAGRKWLAYAAAVLCIVGTGYWMHYKQGKEMQVENQSRASIQPGGDKALLLLDDGTEVALNDLQLGNVAVNGKVLAKKAGEGELCYEDLSSNEVRYHTIRTPRGGQYQITLADGTKVWLNAGSSLRFPTAFVGAERRVEMEGEVFFDVQKDAKRPFVVASARQEVVVHGTQFNVMAYPEEEGVKTSLIEGKVTVAIDGANYLLHPGEESIYDKGKGKVKKESFDPAEILAWREGYFMFNEAHIEEVMRKVARWYDVDVEYRGDMKGKVFSGSVSRFGKVEEVLDMLALTGTVKFKIAGRRILVMG